MHLLDIEYQITMDKILSDLVEVPNHKNIQKEQTGKNLDGNSN
jgi:hypothetical protein